MAVAADPYTAGMRSLDPPVEMVNTRRQPRKPSTSTSRRRRFTSTTSQRARRRSTVTVSGRPPRRGKSSTTVAGERFWRHETFPFALGAAGIVVIHATFSRRQVRAARLA